MQDKAHRKKQGAGVVTYAKPLLRNNAVLRILYDQHRTPVMYAI